LAPPPTPGTGSVVPTVWRSPPLSEEELSELPECVLCERLVRRAERGVRSGARVPSLRVSRVTLSGAAGTARVERGLGPKGDGGEERGRNRPAQPARDAGNREAGFGSAWGNSLASARQSDALGSAGKRAPGRGGGSRPFGRARGPCAGDRAGTGSAHPLRSTHPPTRVREWVSYEADRGSGGVVSDPASEPCHELPEAGEWGMWVAALGAAAHSRDRFCCANRVEVTPS
jgi:hypothetical protein